MRAVAEHYISEDEYAAMEESSPIKHEYFNGRIYAMAGGSPAHNLLSHNVQGSLFARLRGKPCRGASSDQQVKIEATGLRVYPDALIVCPPERYDERFPNVLLNPAVIIEVLSPSTERLDRTDKFEHYRQIAALNHYILIAQDRVYVEHLQRNLEDVWTRRTHYQREDTLTLADLDLEIPLDEIYDRLDLPTGLLLLNPEEEQPATEQSTL